MIEQEASTHQQRSLRPKLSSPSSREPGVEGGGQRPSPSHAPPSCWSGGTLCLPQLRGPVPGGSSLPAHTCRLATWPGAGRSSGFKVSGDELTGRRKMGLRYPHHPLRAWGHRGLPSKLCALLAAGEWGGGRREQPPSPSREPWAAARISVPG